MVKLYLNIFDKLAPLDQRQDIFPFSRIRTTKKFSRFGVSNQLIGTFSMKEAVLCRIDVIYLGN